MALNEKCQRCARKIPWVAFAGNSVLATFKIFVGFVSGSKGLIADGLHSGSDVLATIMVLISLKISDREDDEKHPWGYGKVEFAGALFVYSILFVISIVLFYDAIIVIIEGNTKPPHIFALFAALVSITANYILSSYSYCAGKKLSSPALIANANENRADMISSMAVVIGIAGANMGFLVMDSIAAVFVSLFIFRMAVTLGISAYRNLLDASLTPEKVSLVEKFINQYGQVRGINYIRTRRVGQGVWIDTEIYVDPRLSVKQGYMIAREIRLGLIRKFEQIKDVAVSYSCSEEVGYRRKFNPEAINRITQFFNPLARRRHPSAQDPPKHLQEPKNMNEKEKEEPGAMQKILYGNTNAESKRDLYKKKQASQTSATAKALMDVHEHHKPLNPKPNHHKKIQGGK